MDFADAGSEAADYHLALAILQHNARCSKPQPLPDCEFCESFPVAILPNGAKSKLCERCIGEME